MKNLIMTLMLVFSVSLFSGTAIAQEENDTSVVRVCYNTSVKVKSYKKEGKESKEGKAKAKENCFELTNESLTLTDHKGKKHTYMINDYEPMMTSSGWAYVLYTTMDGKEYELLVHSELQYVGIFDVKKNTTTWYFMML